MCVYCFCGDWAFRHDPPWDPTYWPKKSPKNPWVDYPGVDYPNPNDLLPLPVSPKSDIKPWDLDKLKEYLDLLQRIKNLEDQVGCPCEPNKADYLSLFKQRIEELEKKVEKKSNGV
jgi:hypothetical protein